MKYLFVTLLLGLASTGAISRECEKFDDSERVNGLGKSPDSTPTEDTKTEPSKAKEAGGGAENND